MARRKRDEDSGGTWLDTYADMVTLLLTFFVVLVGMASFETETIDILIRSFSGTQALAEGAGGAGGAYSAGEMSGADTELNMDTLYEKIKDYIESQGMEASVSISKHEDIVYIRFNSQILFEPDRYILVNEAKPLLGFIGEVLKMYEEKIRVINVCGHTAQTGRVKSEVSDWRLSGERAATVAMFFEDDWNIDKQKMITFGYGDNYPIADNATEPGRQQNRRVELVIVGEESLMNFDVYGILGGIFDSNQFPTSGGANELLTPGGASTN